MLIQRRKAPNLGCWSPIGGKLEMAQGESPFECAVREVGEEIGVACTAGDLHLWGYISEKSYEGSGHWLMFLFDCHRLLEALPEHIDEGRFAFFSRGDIEALKIPETDRTLLWPHYDRFRTGFVGLRADCHPGQALSVVIEQTLPGAPAGVS